MRPIDKGGIPTTVDGEVKTVRDYKQWRAYLIDRIGFYCCYCNIPLKDSPQVEHVIAQDIDPLKALDWENMLLACGPCNRTKSAQSCPPATHYLPQYHNTHLGFIYFISSDRINNHSSAFARPANGTCDMEKSYNTINLCGLDRDTTRDVRTATDLRWKYRSEALLKARIWRNEFNSWANVALERFMVLLKTMVEETGFWSIWYKEFEDIFEIRKMLVTEIIGTDLGSFDEINFTPIPRKPLYSGDII